MSADFNIQRSNTSSIHNENTGTQFSGEANSAFKDIPAEILTKIFKTIPYSEMNSYNIGPKGVSRRWKDVSADSANRRSFKSPKGTNTPLRILNGQKRPSGSKDSEGSIKRRRLEF